jgi:hypothetical protein
VKAEDIPQDQHSALAGGQQLKGGDESQRDGFGGFVAGLGAGCAVGEPVEQGFWAGLKPGDLS